MAAGERIQTRLFNLSQSGRERVSTSHLMIASESNPTSYGTSGSEEDESYRRRAFRREQCWESRKGRQLPDDTEDGRRSRTVDSANPASAGLAVSSHRPGIWRV